MAHQQVTRNQEFNQATIGRINAVLLTENAYIARAQNGMVAATPFGNIVKKRRNIKNPRLVPTGCQLRAKRVFVRVIRNKKATHVAQHHQGVLVDGVYVEQVMLHLPHNISERPQITSQYGVLVHQPHCVRNTLWRF